MGWPRWTALFLRRLLAINRQQFIWGHVPLPVRSRNFQPLRSLSSSSWHWKALANTGVKSTRIGGQDVEFKVVGHGSKMLLCNPGFMATGLFQFGGLAEALNDDLALVLWNPPFRDCNGKLRKMRRKLIEDADIASELMQRIHADRYHVLGFSKGCVSSAILASHQPHAVAKLVLCNCPYNFQESSINASVTKCLRKYEEFLKTQKIPPALKVYVDDVGYKNAVDMTNDCLEFMELELQKGSISRLLADCCARVKAPVLLLQATEDKFNLHAHAREFSTNFLNSSFIEIPGEDHDMMGYVEKIAPRVLDFLREDENNGSRSVEKHAVKMSLLASGVSGPIDVGKYGHVSNNANLRNNSTQVTLH